MSESVHYYLDIYSNLPIRISSRIKWYRPPRKNLYKVGGLIPAPIPTPSHQGKGSAAIR